MTYGFKRVIHNVDSDIVRAQIQRESYGFGSFVATKIAEIQNKSEPIEWWWVATSENPADMVTRPTRPSQIGPASMWQRGPKFLSKPLEQWPISQFPQVQEDKLSYRIGAHIMNLDRHSAVPDEGEIISLKNFNSYIDRISKNYDAYHSF